MGGISKLENSFAKYIGTKYGVAVNNGTSALILAIKTLGIGKGDEVIGPAFTMIATKWAIDINGATYVPIDCGNDLNIDVDEIESNITDKTKAIICTHIYGRPCNMSKIVEICEKYKLRLIEDAAEIHGGKYLGKRLGSFGDISCFSFYSNKIVSGEEGGICLTDNEGFKRRMSWLKCHAFGDGLYKYRHKEQAFNFRIPESQAKLILKSLKKVEKNLKKRKKIESWFDEYLKIKTKKREVVWVYDFLTDNKERLFDILEENDVEVRPFFYPIGFAKKALMKFNKGLYIQIRTSMTKRQVKNICKLINQYGV